MCAALSAHAPTLTPYHNNYNPNPKQVVTNSESPVVVVLSGSMEPAFQRGDILFLDNSLSDPIRVGEIVVFKIKGRDIPIVHRVLTVHDDGDLDGMRMLTKGDNNQVDDRGLYAQHQTWLEREDVLGTAKMCLPYVGTPLVCSFKSPRTSGGCF